MMQSLPSGSLDLSAILKQRGAAAVAAVLLGLFLVLGAGLLGSEQVHEAAHDARHALGFPCH